MSSKPKQNQTELEFPSPKELGAVSLIPLLFVLIPFLIQRVFPGKKETIIMAYFVTLGAFVAPYCDGETVVEVLLFLGPAIVRCFKTSLLLFTFVSLFEARVHSFGITKAVFGTLIFFTLVLVRMVVTVALFLWEFILAFERLMWFIFVDNRVPPVLLSSIETQGVELRYF